MAYLNDDQRRALIEYVSKCELHAGIVRDDPKHLQQVFGLCVLNESFEVQEVEVPTLKDPAIRVRFIDHLTPRSIMLYGEHFTVDKVVAFLSSVGISLAPRWMTAMRDQSSDLASFVTKRQASE